jgi:anti-sigma B factor antagonist
MPPTPPPSRLRLETMSGVTVVSFLDPVIVDDVILNEVRDELYRLVDVGKKTNLLLNLGGVRRFSTQFLGNLLGLKQRILKAKGILKMCQIAPNLMDAIKLCHLEKEFSIYKEEQAALNAF